MRDAVIPWMRERMGGDVRVLHELVLGARRADLVFVGERDIAAVEIKSGRDRLDRLRDQVREYSFYVPEVWIALAPKWIDARSHRHYGINRLLVDAGATPQVVWLEPHASKPFRDELVCSRLLELLWASEALAIAQRTDVLPGPAYGQLRKDHVKKLLARLLTGNEIVAEVCRELRSRPLTGLGSDDPVGVRSAPL